MQVLLGLVTLCSVGPDIDTSDDTYLRTVHLDLSGHAVSTAQLKEVLLEAPRRLKQCYMLESLVLVGCQLPTGGRHVTTQLPNSAPSILMRVQLPRPHIATSLQKLPFQAIAEWR
jgi:hypothetical protein